MNVEPNWVELKWCLKEEEMLVLVLADIGNFREQSLPLQVIERLNTLLKFFATAGKEVILRVVYDREGKGMEREPSFLSDIQEHMRQLGPVLQQNQDIIFTLQGLFIGSWGEMHSSRFLRGTQLCQLADTLWESLKGSCFLAVRRPVYWRIIQGTEENERQIGLYNDGMFGSDSDLGTYGEAGENAAWESSWGREQELVFQEDLCKKVPNGGEAVDSEESEDLEKTVQELRRMHVSYLNGVYHPKRLESWRRQIWRGNDCFCGMDGLHYIGCHLGYRLVVRQAQLSGKSGSQLQVTVENTGFARPYFETVPELFLKDAYGGCQQILASEDAYTWESGEMTILSFSLEEIVQGPYTLYLGLRRKQDGKYLLFANQEAHQRPLLPDFTTDGRSLVLLGRLMV